MGVLHRILRCVCLKIDPSGWYRSQCLHSQRVVVIVDWWSAANAKSHGRSNDGQYLGVYVGLGFLGAGFLLTELWSVHCSKGSTKYHNMTYPFRLIFVTIISRTAKHLHEDLLKTIMR